MTAEFRAEKAGFAKEAQERMMGKFDPEQAAKTLMWIYLQPKPDNCPEHIYQSVASMPGDMRTVDHDIYANYLTNGLLLGYLMACLDNTYVNVLCSSSTWKVSDKTAFEISRQRERIGLFLKFISDYGLRSSSQFQTDQLYEKTALAQVIVCLSQLGSLAQTKPNYKGPKNYWLKAVSP